MYFEYQSRGTILVHAIAVTYFLRIGWIVGTYGVYYIVVVKWLSIVWALIIRNEKSKFGENLNLTLSIFSFT